MRTLLLSLPLLLAFPAPVRAQARATDKGGGGLTLVNLETNAAPQALGIDDRAPRLSWALESGRRGVSQAACRVLVASRPELAREGRADVWDSGRVTSPDPWVVYAGPALKSRTRYYWTARAWAADGLVSGRAQPAWFETALFDAGEWKGRRQGWCCLPVRGHVAVIDQPCMPKNERACANRSVDLSASCRRDQPIQSFVAGTNPLM